MSLRVSTSRPPIAACSGLIINRRANELLKVREIGTFCSAIQTVPKPPSPRRQEIRKSGNQESPLNARFPRGDRIAEMAAEVVGNEQQHGQ